MEKKNLSDLLAEIPRNPKKISENILKVIGNLGHGKVLMNFNGEHRYWSEGRLVTSDIHRNRHKIIELEGGLFLADSQEDCVDFGRNYCGEDTSTITLNRFYKDMNPEKIAEFLKAYEGRVPELKEVEAVFGHPNNFGYLVIDCLDEGILKVRASQEGGVDGRKKKEEVLIKVGGFFAYNESTVPHQEARKIIQKLRESYKNPE